MREAAAATKRIERRETGKENDDQKGMTEGMIVEVTVDEMTTKRRSERSSKKNVTLTRARALQFDQQQSCQRKRQKEVERLDFNEIRSATKETNGFPTEKKH